jgi:serine phosphatase RsbU (regulator of sigma subunit)
VIRQKGHLPNDEFIRSLMESITAFIDGAEQFDDIAITTLKVL